MAEFGDLLKDPLLAASGLSLRCHLCRLSRSDAETFLWLEAALTDQVLTQEEICAELERRTGQRFRQPQLSYHKTHHHDPRLAELREKFIAHAAILRVRGELDPVDHAMAEQEVALAKLQELLDVEDDPAVAAKLAGQIATLADHLAKSSRLPAQVALDEHRVHEAAVREQLASGEFEQAFVAWIQRQHPEFVEWDRARRGAQDRHE